VKLMDAECENLFEKGWSGEKNTIRKVSRELGRNLAYADLGLRQVPGRGCRKKKEKEPPREWGHDGASWGGEKNLRVRKGGTPVRLRKKGGVRLSTQTRLRQANETRKKKGTCPRVYEAESQREWKGKTLLKNRVERLAKGK